MGRLANEKTLELNISHELLDASGYGAFGFTQEQESIAGGDVLFPCSIPFLLQFKAAKEGIDDNWGRFEINNNKWKNQHMTLHALASHGLCRALYIFPLIITDSFLTTHFGHLLDYTCAIDANFITQNQNWHFTSHNVIMNKNYHFQVRSEKSEGIGFPAKQLIDYLKDKKVQNQVPISEYVPELIKKLDIIAKEAQIVGNSEHTIYIMATDRKEKFGYLALPVIIRGIKRKELNQANLDRF